eukprot:6126840-Ditylum_brightwellii.AAC.1
MAYNLDQCLDVITVHIFLNKACKLQKRRMQYITHKSRHMSACKWIARVTKLINYLTEFLMPCKVVPRKMDQEEILKVLENIIHTA